VRSVAKELASMAAALRPIRHGLNPWSAVALALGSTRNLRFRGQRVRGANRGLLIELSKTVWGGEYDAPGFVPAAGEHVIDVGANVGFFSVLAASRGARVAAYEPHPETFAFLAENTAPWGVACHRAAVVSRPPPRRKVPLWVHPTHDSRHSVIEGGAIDDDALNETIEVDAVALSDVIGEGCDLLKLDCEGAEFDLLAHTAPEALTRARRIVAETHERAGEVEAARARLVELGFRTRFQEKAGGLGLLFAARDGAAG
jgi:FkbM family methyltransferase